jgi:hypothetical protein
MVPCGAAPAPDLPSHRCHAIATERGLLNRARERRRTRRRLAPSGLTEATVRLSPWSFCDEGGQGDT